jgi:hypothetical protein
MVRTLVYHGSIMVRSTYHGTRVHTGMVPVVHVYVHVSVRTMVPTVVTCQLAAVYPPKTHVVLSAHVCPLPIRKL